MKTALVWISLRRGMRWLSPVSTHLCSLGHNCYRSISSLCGRGIPAVTTVPCMFLTPHHNVRYKHTQSHPHTHITHKHPHTHSHTHHHTYINTHHKHTQIHTYQVTHTHLHTDTSHKSQYHTYTAPTPLPPTHILPLGKGMHFKHFPQLHFPPPIMADFLHMLSRFMSLDG